MFQLVIERIIVNCRIRNKHFGVWKICNGFGHGQCVFAMSLYSSWLKDVLNYERRNLLILLMGLGHAIWKIVQTGVLRAANNTFPNFKTTFDSTFFHLHL